MHGTVLELFGAHSTGSSESSVLKDKTQDGSLCLSQCLYFTLAL